MSIQGGLPGCTKGRCHVPDPTMGMPNPYPPTSTQTDPYATPLFAQGKYTDAGEHETVTKTITTTETSRFTHKATALGETTLVTEMRSPAESEPTTTIAGKEASIVGNKQQPRAWYPLPMEAGDWRE